MTSPKLIKNDNLEEEHQEAQGRFEQSERSELYIFSCFGRTPHSFKMRLF